MLFGAQHNQQLLEFHQRLTIMEDKVEQMLQRHDVTDDVIVEIKSRLEDQGSLLHLLMRQGRATTRQQCMLWSGSLVIVVLLFIIVFKI